MAELRALGAAQDTVVLFTSDHGDFLGDHQLMLKGPLHYRGLVRVPFVWSDPAGPKGSRSKALAQTTDIAPSILERAGVEPWNGIQGRSLLPLMNSRVKTLRERLLIEEEGQRYYLGFKDRVRMRSLVTARHRLSVYDGVPWGELYDLQEDPDELVNCWGDPAAAGLRAGLMEELARAMIDQAETSPTLRRSLRSRARPRAPRRVRWRGRPRRRPRAGSRSGGRGPADRLRCRSPTR